MKRGTAHGFYRLMQCMGDLKLPEDTGDFRLMSRRVVDAVRQLREQHRFMKGLFAWVGYPTTFVLYDRAPRYAGDSKWSYWKLWNLAMEGITSFTVMPLKLATYVGLVVALLSVIYAVQVIVKTLIIGNPVGGLSKPDDGGAVPRRDAADVSRCDRRIPGQGLQRDQSSGRSIWWNGMFPAR